MARQIRSPACANSTTPTDFVAIAIAYAEDVIEDTAGEWTGKYLRLAARRFLRDLERSLSKRPPFVFSAAKANAACRFIEGLPHVEGEWETPNIVLQPAQIFFVVQIFGFRKHDGTRRFTEVLYSTARKNAKSTIAAGILMACFCLEKDNGAQAISAATTGSQARIIWGIAKRMVERSESLRAHFDLETFANSIARYEIGGSFKPINSKASTQDGLNPSYTGIDEIHAHKNPDLVNVLRSAAGGRKSPLWLYTTTEGYPNAGPWGELRGYALRLLEGAIKAAPGQRDRPGDHFLALLYMMDETDDELDARKWPKSNPLYFVNPYLRDEISKLAESARQMPSVMAEFRIKRCNVPSASSAAWVNLRKWDKCAGPVDLDRMVGLPCWAALDLASTEDIAAWRLLWYDADADVYFTWGRRWCPSERVKQRKEAGRVPYAGWVEAGFITQTEGDVTDYDVIQRDILQDHARFAPRKIGYDPWNATSLVNDLSAEGLPMELFRQGFQTYNPAIKAAEVAYLSGKLRTGGDPVLRWMIANVVPRRDANLNLAPDRKRSADKIDDACSLFMAFGLATAEVEQGDAAGFYTAPVKVSR